jgi:hypothetical protein
MTDEFARQDLLRTGGALASTAAVGDLGGCVDVLTGGGGSTESDDDALTYETVDVEFSLDSWLFVPGTIEDRSHYPFVYRSYEAFAAAIQHMSSQTAESINRGYQGHPMTGIGSARPETSQSSRRGGPRSSR